MTCQPIEIADNRNIYATSNAGREQIVGCQREAGHSAAIRGEIKPTLYQTEPRPQSPILNIAFGLTRILRSSSGSSWRGILLERHLYSPGERTSASLDRHVISMSHGSPSHFEHRNLSGEFIASLTRQGTIMISPPGPIPDIRLHTPAEFIHCAFEEAFTRRVLEELEQPGAKPMDLMHSYGTNVPLYPEFQAFSGSINLQH